jgi:hypothetical protein
MLCLQSILNNQGVRLRHPRFHRDTHQFAQRKRSKHGQRLLSFGRCGNTSERLLITKGSVSLNLANTFFLALFLVVPLGGCASLMAPIDLQATAPPGITAVSLDENALVFGRIRWRENGIEREVYKSGGLGWNLYPLVLNVADKQTRRFAVKSDGRFYWVLPKGRYMLYRLNWFDPVDGWHRVEPKVAFQAEGNPGAYYLGVLIVEIAAKRDFLGGLWIKGVSVSVNDETEQDAPAFRGRYADPDLTLAKALMLHDPRLPEDPRLERKARLAEIMRSLYFGLMTLQY